MSRLPTALEVRHLRVLLALEEHQHFGRAARELGISQPVVSRTLREVEGLLGGVQLFERDTRTVRITEAGRALCASGRAALEQLQRGVHEAQRLARGEAGQLRVMLTPMTGLGQVPVALAAFRTRWPEVMLEIRHGSTRALLDALREDTVDLGFTMLFPAAPDLGSTWVERDELVAVVPDTDPDAAVDIRALLERPFILMGRDSEPGIAAAWELLHAWAPLRLAAEVDHIEAMLGLVAAGLGVSMAPRRVRHILLPGLRLRPLQPPLSTGVQAVWSAERGLGIPGARLLRLLTSAM